MVSSLIDESNKIVYVFDEEYEKGLMNDQIAELLLSKGMKREDIFADNAEPKSIEEIKSRGLRNIQGGKKGADSIRSGIQFMKQFHFIVHPSCKNLIQEFMDYNYKKDNATGHYTNDVQGADHCITGDTLIDTEHGQIPIEDLVGTTGRVHGYNFDTQEAELMNYEDVRMTREQVDVFMVTLESGRKVKATEDHLFLTTEGWKPLKELTDNDSIVDVSGVLVAEPSSAIKADKVSSIEYIGKADVYNMEVEEYENYSVEGGLIIHNCIDALRYSMQKIQFTNRVSFIPKSVFGL